MMKPIAIASLILAVSAASALAQATTRKTGSFIDGATVGGEDVDIDAAVTFGLQGGRFTSADLDACIATDPQSGVSDRLKTALTVQGNALVGSGKTGLGRQDFTVALTRSGTAAKIKLAGSIKVGEVSIRIERDDIELEAYAAPDGPGEETSSNVPSLNQLQVTFKPELATRVLDVLRKERAEVSPFGLVLSCENFRQNAQTLNVIVHPARVGLVRAGLGAIPGVKTTMNDGGTTGSAVRIGMPASGGLSESDLSAIVVKAVLGATRGQESGPAAMNGNTGAYTIQARRRTTAADRLGFAELITVRYFIGRIEDGRAWHLYLNEVWSRLVDASAEAPLAITGADGGSEEGDAPGTKINVLSDAIVKRIVAATAGQTWDDDGGRWK